MGMIWRSDCMRKYLAIIQLYKKLGSLNNRLLFTNQILDSTTKKLKSRNSHSQQK